MRHASRSASSCASFPRSVPSLAAASTSSRRPTTPARDRSAPAIVESPTTTPGFDQITFNIAGAGVHTITLATPLPDLTDGFEILGFTQPGSSENTNGPGTCPTTPCT